MQDSQVSKIFYERILLWGPVASVLIFFFLNNIVFANSDGAIASQLYLMDYVFINKVHTIVGLILFFFLFEMIKVHQLGLPVISEFLLIYIVVTCFLCSPLIWPNISESTFFLLPYLYLTKWVPYWHNINQSRGIALLYSIKSREHLDQKSQIKLDTLNRRERYFSHLLVVGSFVTPDVGYTFLFKNIKWPPYFFEAGVTIQIFALMGLLLVSYKTSRLIKNPRKFIFDWRYFLYPISSVSIVAFIAIRVNHGIEYFFTMTHVFKHSQTPLQYKKVLLYVMPISALLFSAVFLGREIEQHLTGQVTLVGVIAFNMALTINVTHFYFDSKMFKMKNKRVREFMGSLLIKNES